MRERDWEEWKRKYGFLWIDPYQWKGYYLSKDKI